MSHRHLRNTLVFLTAAAVMGSVLAFAAYFASRVPEEGVVKEHVINHCPDPESLKFVRWGPHDLDDEIGIRWPLYSATLEGSWERMGIGGGAVETADNEDAPRKNMPKTRAMDLSGKPQEYGKPVKIVRIVYRYGKEPHDVLYFVQGQSVVFSLPNDMGNDWKDQWKAAKQRMGK